MNAVALVKRAKKGDKEALMELILEQKDDFYRLALSFMRNPDDAMDIWEDTIVILYRNISELRDPAAFYSWSKRILVNHCKSQLKKRNRLVLMENMEDIGGEANAFDNDDVAVTMEVHEMLEVLNETQREAIILKYLHDLDYKSVSSMTGVSIGTVKSRVFQGIKKLQERFGGADHD